MRATWTLTINGTTYNIGENAYPCYRSHNSDGWQMTEPDSWIAQPAWTDNGDRYILWYYIADANTDLDEIDYDTPDDIELVETAEKD